ncbi:MAG: hypothetical protein ACTHKS_00980 [Gaiellaceae bacterium]
MDQLKALPLGRQLILGAGVLLFVDSLFHWQDYHGFGWTAWHGFWGVLMCLMVIVLVLWTAARAFKFQLPEQIPDGLTTLALGVLIPVFAFIKAISDSYTNWPAWVGVILGAVIAYGAWQVFAASGEKLPQMPARDTTA